MKFKIKIIWVMLFLFTVLSPNLYSMTNEEEKRLMVDVAEIKSTLKTFMNQVDKRFEQIDRRFEQVDKRFSELRHDIDKRFEVMDKRFEDINKRFGDINRRFEDINRRFEDINKRFEDINKRFDDMNKRFDEMMGFMKMMLFVFTTLVAVVIGFAYWDRRTIIRKARDESIEIIEKEGKLRDLILALRELAKENEKLQKVLRAYHLL